MLYPLLDWVSDKYPNILESFWVSFSLFNYISYTFIIELDFQKMAK